MSSSVEKDKRASSGHFERSVTTKQEPLLHPTVYQAFKIHSHL